MTYNLGPKNLDDGTFKSFITDIKTKVRQSQLKVFATVNSELIKLYFDLGRAISENLENHKWGESVVEILSQELRSEFCNTQGFSARNIWRMKKFYEVYKDYPLLENYLYQLTWSNHLHILSKAKTMEEREFYLSLGAKERYSARNFARLIDSGTFQRTIIADQKLSTLLTQFPADTKGVFKDSYIFEFLGLPDDYKENDLQKALIKHLKKFLLELGPDFSFIGEEYVIQIGSKDFRIDILMHHRGLNCLVAIELKITEFLPEYLGKMQFYLEALDRDIKKNHENPSVGIIICATKDEEIVEYAMSRNLSPTMIAEYETKIIDKNLLQAKLHEITDILNFQKHDNEE